MSERSSSASVGEALREAREAQGMTLDEVSTWLRLMRRQLEAMESDDFESLGQPVFARGFVRNYARLLGLDADALLSRMEGAPAAPAEVSHAGPPVSRSWLTSPWLIVLSLGLLAAVVVPVGLYWWLNSEVDEGERRLDLGEERLVSLVRLTGWPRHPRQTNRAIPGQYLQSD